MQLNLNTTLYYLMCLMCIFGTKLLIVCIIKSLECGQVYLLFAVSVRLVTHNLPPLYAFFLELALDPAAWPTLVGGDQIVNFTGTQLDLAAPVRSDDIRNYGQYYLKYLMIKALILIVKCFTVKNIDKTFEARNLQVNGQRRFRFEGKFIINRSFIGHSYFTVKKYLMVT